MRDFLQALKFGLRSKKILFSIVITAFLISILNALAPQVLKLLFDLVDKALRPNGEIVSLSQVFKIALLFFAVTYLSDLAGTLNLYLGSLWTTKTNNDLYEQSLEHAENLSLNYYEEAGTGAVLEKINQGISDTISITYNFMTNILSQIFFMVIALYFLFKINIIFGLIVLLGTPLYAITILIFAGRIHAFQKSVRKLAEQSKNISVETISNVKTVKTFGRESYHLALYKTRLAAYLGETLKRVNVRSKMLVMRNFVLNVCQSLVLFIGVYWTVTGKLTLGTFVLAWSYTNASFGPIKFLVNQVDDIIRDLVSVRRLKDFLDTKPEIVDSPGARDLKNIIGDIRIKNLSFKYKDEKDMVINNLNVKVDKGQVLALVGKSGVGKSTLVKLLLRFYDPIKGEIDIDDTNIKNITQKSLREKIGVVMQDSVIFNDTVLNNIKYGNPEAKKEDVYKAATLANAHEFIMSLPKGYDTVVGERGIKLSGGEQQRVNIARVILKNPPILILDEATSSLDSESEKLIQDALWKLIEGKTTIIIAHRLSTVMRADLIAVLDKGKIVEIDKHENLVKKEGIYSKLFKIQSGGYLK